jgi:hypothetical protein
VFVGAHTVADDGSPPRMSFDVPVTVVSVDDWSADAEKAKGARMEKKGKALQEAGDKSGNKDEEAEGKTMKKKGHAIEKEGEARGDAAEQMEKSGNKAEKAGVESREKSAKAKTDSKK